MPQVKNKTKTKTAAKRANSQQVAIQDRRNLVHKLLLQHYTPRQIAERVDVKTTTIEADIRAIDKGFSGIDSAVSDHRKQRELDDLDMMEHDAMNQLEERVLELATFMNDAEGLKELGNAAPAILSVMYKDAGSWFDRRLKVKQQRGKWLGYEVKELVAVEGAIGNTINVNISMPDGKKVDFGEWAEGQFRDLGKELEGGK